MQIQATAQRTRLCLLTAAIALAALPASAAAEAYVPPGNSAATQYTEAVPTAGGPKTTNKSKHGQSRSPGKVLGAHKTAKLDAQGPEGRAAAKLAASTAPTAVSGVGVGVGVGEGAATVHAHTSPHTTPNGSGSGSGKSEGSEMPANPSGGPAHHDGNLTFYKASGGSSAIGEVAGQATGSSSGQLGIWLPLLIVAVVIWSGAYVLRRQRKRPAG
jgi:hypothetical protein